jgi:signal transduction histidine kinase
MMSVHDKTKEQLIEELEELRRRNAELEKLEAGRKLAEDKMRHQQYYFEKAQEIGAIGTWELDVVQNTLIWTDQNYRNFGVPIGTPLTYETFLNQVHPDDRDYVNKEWMAAIGGKPYDIEHRLIINGDIRWVREKADVVFDEDGSGIYAIGFTQDITSHKQIENELVDAKKEIEQWNTELEARVKEKTDKLKKSQNLLIQSEKLSAMGKMAGGMAHELNSPLAGLVPMLELHKKRELEGSKKFEEVDLMLKTALHMAKIVKDFCVFSRKSKSEFRALSLNEVIEDTLSFSAVRLKHKGINVKKELSGRLPLVLGDKTELQQVVLNMISNALDAMNEGGSYVITTEVSEDNNKIKMQFIDDGSGIAKENLNKIFDPFFTTKKEGEGTGLGLSVSYGIIKNHNGEITVESEPGKETSFSVYIPAANSNNK